ncbi:MULTISPECIES: hypothetical protein [unclassified Anaerobiospirillum]|uniref:hypothetical protein n=1 Tax=unclassified Anaerobiospirillum TaxID=2647410 RepID=UPI001FF6CC50|nr:MULTISPECIES: hypothetical protein [unclassified Anaerobiospirillum]MCK0533708.1 hypothetical protein [Anaerobiospirillum sp. NML120511]MCK0540048.1 hypothetical protein [Anaerobiospirillum sp. NML02-A-032]
MASRNSLISALNRLNSRSENVSTAELDRVSIIHAESINGCEDYDFAGDTAVTTVVSDIELISCEGDAASCAEQSEPCYEAYEAGNSAYSQAVSADECMELRDYIMPESAGDPDEEQSVCTCLLVDDLPDSCGRADCDSVSSVSCDHYEDADDYVDAGAFCSSERESDYFAGHESGHDLGYFSERSADSLSDAGCGCGCAGKRESLSVIYSALEDFFGAEGKLSGLNSSVSNSVNRSSCHEELSEHAHALSGLNLSALQSICAGKSDNWRRFCNMNAGRASRFYEPARASGSAAARASSSRSVSVSGKGRHSFSVNADR